MSTGTPSPPVARTIVLSERLRLPMAGTGRVVTAALVVYALCRLVTTVVLMSAMHGQVPTGMTGGDQVPVTYWNFLALWDGQWYQRIAEGGYPNALPVDPTGKVEQNPWAFYPLFPLASRLVMALTGLSFPVVGGLLALLCGFGAAAFMAALLGHRIGVPSTLAVVALWASFPASVALQLAYTESLAMLLLTAYLYALDRERWLVATGVALLVGLSRPIAVPLGLVTLAVVVARWRGRTARPVTRGEYLSMAAALVGCGVAGLIWPVVAWLATGSRSAYTDTMASWRAYPEVQWFTPWYDKATWWLGETWGVLALFAVPVLIAVMVLGPWADRLGLAMRTWALGYPLYLAAVLDPFTSLPRYLIPLFPLLVPLVGAGWADGRGQRPGRVLVRTLPLLVLCVWGQYWWADTLWVFTPPSDYPP